MDIKGWVRNSLIDYPDHIATVLFTGGCNFRCPMCHNADLVLRHSEMEMISDSAVFSFLNKRKGFIDGVVVTGGEPTLQPDLVPFLQQVKECGMDVKLDTNGSTPEVLSSVLAQDVVDYIAMDIKAPRGKYHRLAGTNRIHLDTITHSLQIIMCHSVRFECRTTIVPGLLNHDDIEQIARWLAGIMTDNVNRCHYILQQFRSEHTLDPELLSSTPYTKIQLQEMADRARRWLPDVSIRGI